MAPKLRQIPALAVAIMAGCSSAPKLDPILEEVISGIQEKVEGIPGTSVTEIQALQHGTVVAARMKTSDKKDPFIECTPYPSISYRTGRKEELLRVNCDALKTDAEYGFSNVHVDSYNALKTWEIPSQTPGTPSWKAAADQMGTDIARFLEEQQ